VSAPRGLVIQLREALATVVGIREALEYGDGGHAADLAAGLEGDLLTIVEQIEADRQ
jgi:hypothetical protein